VSSLAPVVEADESAAEVAGVEPEPPPA
jgi:hypothetical protein